MISKNERQVEVNKLREQSKETDDGNSLQEAAASIILNRLDEANAEIHYLKMRLIQQESEHQREVAQLQSR
jgi:hypothetical protein